MAFQEVLRSTLILPVNVPRFVEKACERGADAVMLDLEDAVPAGEKDRARRLVAPSLAQAGRGGGQVLVRVNNDPELLEADLEASIHPGLDCLVLPKAESLDQVAAVDEQITRLEKARGLMPGGVGLSLIVETPLGLMNLREIASASPRIQVLSAGAEDYCLELGVEPSPEGTEVFVLLALVVAAAKARGLKPVGQLGSVAGFKDLAGFERAALGARRLGCEGGLAIHPHQVPVLNRVFSPDPEKVAEARRVTAAFEAGLEQGTASVSLNGRMVDRPGYVRALRLVQRAQAIARLEERKTQAAARLAETA
ncbi:MAG: CoA ester lyase [Thermodesulfobacteriota bacterium]